MHPVDEIRGSKSLVLHNKIIILGVTGSIAAVESIRLARELIRHGAEIVPVMTPASTRIIHPDALWFATGKKPIIELSGNTEHVRWCGKGEQKADALLISPSTANTISKISYGIDDTAITTFATTAIGSGIPIVIVPAMHLSMYDHKIIQENIERLKKQDIVFVEPKISGNKAKMASIDQIVMEIRRAIGFDDLNGKSILIIGGGTAEKVDDVRLLCNRSSGTMAMSLALHAYEHGADVEFWYGRGNKTPPDFLSFSRFTSICDVQTLLASHDMKGYDVIIVCAALSDYIPNKKDGKLSSKLESLEISCSSAPKILPLLKKNAPNAIIVGFKLEDDESNLIDKAKKLQEKYDIDYVVANTIANIDEEKGELWIIDRHGNSKHVQGTKDQLADDIYDTIGTNDS
jgi:phosphopantothenoylcysteine decarboxylase/phosphopantothenate--cysteine ligase